MLEIGTDIVEVERIKNAILKYPIKFPEKILSKEERLVYEAHKNKPIYLAGRFAAKEAVLKAFGMGLRNCSWHDIVISNDKLGKPVVNLKGNLALMANKLSVRKIHLSISHSHMYAIAFCVLEEQGERL